MTHYRLPINGTPYRMRSQFVSGSEIIAAGGIDPFFPFVKLLLHGNGSSFVDSSSFNRAVTPNGLVSLSTLQSQWGGSSILFNGGHLYFNSTDFNIGSGDCSIEFWLYTSNTTSGQNIIDLRPPTTNGRYPVVYLFNGILSYQFDSITVNGSILPATNIWNYIALKKTGNTTELWLNGAIIGSAVTGDWSNSNGIFVGTGAFGVPYYGYLDDIRFTSYARDVSAVPTSQFPDS